jgi:hypothetical protein
VKRCECGGKTPFRFLDYDRPREDGMLGLIYCGGCRGLYRPSHRTHEGDGTPNLCQFCQDYLRTHASQETQKV